MRFGAIAYLALLLVLPVLIGLSVRGFSRTAAWLYRFSGAIQPKGPAICKTICLGLSFACLCLALAKPRISVEKTVIRRQGIAIAVGIDVSKSMLAEDIPTSDLPPDFSGIANRLNHARWFALSLLDHLQGERIGVFLFAQQGVAIVPLTADYGYCRYVIGHLRPTELTLAGSDLSAALRTGVSMIQTRTHAKAGMVLLLSDGEETAASLTELKKAGRAAAQKGGFIHAHGIGTVTPRRIPIRGPDGVSLQGYYQDEQGNPLKTRLEPRTLKALARAGNGRYFPPESRPRPVVDALISELKDQKAIQVQKPVQRDLSMPFLLSALLFFAFSLSGRKRFFGF